MATLRSLFTKKELQAQIESIDVRIDKLKRRPAVTIEEAESNRMDLQKLEAARGDLLEKVRLAPE